MVRKIQKASRLTPTYLLVAVVCSLLLDAVCELRACVFSVVGCRSTWRRVQKRKVTPSQVASRRQVQLHACHLPLIFPGLHTLGQGQGKQNQAFSCANDTFFLIVQPSPLSKFTLTILLHCPLSHFHEFFSILFRC